MDTHTHTPKMPTPQPPEPVDALHDVAKGLCTIDVTQLVLLSLFSPGGVWLFWDSVDWDFAGTNTAVGCLFLLQGHFPMPGSNLHLWASHTLAHGFLTTSATCAWPVAQSRQTLWPQGPQPARLLCPWDFPGKNTGVGCHFLLQRSPYLGEPNRIILTL